MKPSEFKKIYPEYENLEGDELWNKIEDIQLEKQKQILSCEVPDLLKLSEEDEIQYQKDKELNNSSKNRILNYTRKWWIDWDKPNPLPKTSSMQFFIMDLSKEGPDALISIEQYLKEQKDDKGI